VQRVLDLLAALGPPAGHLHGHRHHRAGPCVRDHRRAPRRKRRRPRPRGHPAGHRPLPGGPRPVRAGTGHLPLA
jgi:hypothetical protein